MQPPAAPTGVTATAATATSIDINWSLVPGATSYNIYRSTAPNVAIVAGNKINAAAVAAGPYGNTGITTGVTYYKVTAVNGNGESVGSVEVSATPTTPPPAPPTISGFTPLNASVGAVVTISGTNFSATVTNNTVVIGGVVATVTAATTTSITTKVPAGAVTGPISVTTAVGTATSLASFTVLQPPATPTGITATTVSATSININWNLVTGVTSYNIYRSTTPGITIYSTKVGTAAAGPFGNTGLTSGVTYYYIVTAVNTSGESPASLEVSATTSAPPNAPSGVTAIAGIGQNTISWAPASGATSYNIYWTTGATAATTAGTKIANVASPAVHTGLTTGTTYNYVVTAVNGSGESIISTQVSATPGLPSITGRFMGVSAQLYCKTMLK